MQPLLNCKGTLEMWSSVFPGRGGKLVNIWPIVAAIQGSETVAVCSEAILTPKKNSVILIPYTNFLT